MTTIANQRNQLAAAMLAFFLGHFGAHWYYLGAPQKGNLYLAITMVSFALCLIVIGFAGLLIMWIMCLVDMITLLSMQPRAFNEQYNR